ncbi:MAG: RNA pseudouridine synthase [Polyangiaceae bacterium]
MSGSRAPTSAVTLPILGEYRGLVFVDKPAGLQTEPDARTTDTLVSRLAAQLGEPAARVHALSRLDTGVSGVVTLGLTADARRMVQEWRERGRFERRYLALSGGQPELTSGAWRESIGRAAGTLRAVAGRNAELSHTDYAVIASSERAERATPSRVHLLALAPRTGRTHQLRVHCAAHALPLLGDRAYGGASRMISGNGAVTALDRIALHAAWVELPLAQPLRIQALTPPWLLDIWRAFQGNEADFARGREVELGA